MVVKAKEWLPRKATRLDPEAARLLANVFTQPPEDDGPRLVYADWLMERKDPRGEFISLQCRLAKMPSSDPEWSGLYDRLTAIEEEWLPQWAEEVGWPLKSFGGLRYTRGFVESLDTEAKILVPIADALFEREPIRKMRMRALKPVALFEKFLAFPALQRLEDLDLWGQNSFSAKQAAAIVSCPNLKNLRKLRFYTCGLGPKGGIALAEKLDLPKLRRLEIGDNKIGDEGAIALAKRKTLPPELLIHSEYIGEAGVTGLAASPALESVEVLELGTNRFGDPGMMALARARLGRLRELSVRYCEFGPRGAQALAAAPWFAQLESLTLSGNEIGPEGGAAIAAALPRGLRRLEIDHCGLDAKAADAIAGAKIDALQELNIGGNAQAPSFLPALAAASFLPKLTRLQADGDQLPDSAWLPFLTAKPSPFAGIEELRTQSFVGSAANVLAQMTGPR